MGIVALLATVWVAVTIPTFVFRNTFLTWVANKLRERAEILKMQDFMSQENFAEILRKAGNDKTGE